MQRRIDARSLVEILNKCGFEQEAFGGKESTTYSSINQFPNNVLKQKIIYVDIYC